MPTTIAGILTFMDRISFRLSGAAHKKFCNLGAWSRGYKIIACSTGLSIRYQLLIKNIILKKSSFKLLAVAIILPINV